MEHPVASNYLTSVRRILLAMSAVAITVPSLGLAGWLTGMPLLASYGGQFIPMAPSTAICFVSLGLSLLLVLRPEKGPEKGPVGHRIAGFAGWTVAVYGLLVAVASFTGAPFNPDDWLFPDTGSLGNYPLGRMSPVTALFFLLSGSALATFVRGVAPDNSANRSLSLAAWASSGVLLGGLVFTLGYALGTPLLYSGGAIPLALPTALSFLALGGALTTATVCYSPVSGHWYRTLNDMPVGSQLRLGLGIIFVFVILLGSQAWLKTDLIWKQTQTIYEHPLQVRRAVGYLEGSVERMSRHVRDLLLAQNEQEIAASLQTFEIERVEAERQLAILHDRYLGPRDDVVALQSELAKWHVFRVETVRLFRAGNTPEAVARIRPGGAQDLQAQAIRARLGTIDRFAINKGDQLYLAASQQKEALNRQLGVVVAVILLLSLIVYWRLQLGIKEPMEHLLAAVEQFRQGKTESRSGYVSANEFGGLSTAFNALADMIETQLRINGKAAQLAGVMLRESEARTFCRELLKALLAQTDSQLGAVYLLNPQRTDYELFESVGLNAGARASFSAVNPEGEFGLALATGQMQRIVDIPDDTRFTFATVTGGFRPRGIVTIPLVWEHQAGAVLCLASLRGYDEPAVRLLEGVLDTVTARMNGVLAYRQIQELAGRLDLQNRELEAQKDELVAQAKELAVQNTELELQKRQLDEANRLKSAFLSNMSHELRTPLNSVIALSGVLRRRLARSIPEEEYGYLEVIERNGRHLLALINDILDLSRIEAGREELNLASFSLRALVDEIVTMLAHQAKEKEVALDSCVGDDLPPVVSDPDKVRHILQNLIGNAVKFTEVGSVEVTALKAGEAFQVSVRDTGIGIAADQLPSIFEEFRQVDSSSSRKYGGTGLGLAIAKKYATLLQGDIVVESTPGRGSTFTLRLPLALSHAEHEPDSALPAGVAPAGSKNSGGQARRILLVEDSEPAIIQVTDILTRNGWQVDVARNGREALAKVEAFPPDALILDLMMPEMDGFEVLRQIRGKERSIFLPVLILTAKHVTREELSFLKGNHIHQLIQKGDIGGNELLAAVERMVRPQPDGAVTLAGGRRSRGRSGKPVVLVVEDNPDNLRAARALLEQTCELFEATDGRAGVEQARRHRPDLILMDLSMPVMDGFAALVELRADEALCDIPVVAVTVSAMKGDREEILAHGFDGYLSKPIDAELLHKVMREVLHGTQ